MIEKAGNLVSIFSSFVAGLNALKSGDTLGAAKHFATGKDNMKALFGDEEAKKRLNAREKEILKKQTQDKIDYEIKAKAEADKKAEAEAKLTGGINTGLAGDISGTLTASKTANQAKTNNVYITFEALTKIMGNQVVGKENGREVLDLLNEGFMTVLNNANLIIAR